MKAWQLEKPQTFQEINAIEPLVNHSVKVRIKNLGISRMDLSVYAQKINAQYPIIPGRQAMGVISEIAEDVHGLYSGQRVALESCVPCGQCYNCKTGNAKNCSNLLVYGKDLNGFARDFVVLPAENVIELPDSVSDNEAIFIEHIAASINTMQILKPQPGECVLIMGADIMGNILAQLALFYHAVPIVLDNSEQRLDLVRDFGIDHVYNTDDKDIFKKMKAITAGKMAECVVFTAAASLPFYAAIDLAAYGGRLAVISLANENILLSTNLEDITTKQLTLHGISNDIGATASAINMLVNKIIRVDNLITSIVPYEQLPKTFEDLSRKPQIFLKTIVKI